MRNIKGTRLIGLVGGIATAVVVIMLIGGIALAQRSTPTPDSAGNVPTHQQMDRMMDDVHGEGASKQMHDAMGPNAEQLMDQCITMMGNMQQMQNVMGGMWGVSIWTWIRNIIGL